MQIKHFLMENIFVFENKALNQTKVNKQYAKIEKYS